MTKCFTNSQYFYSSGISIYTHLIEIKVPVILHTHTFSELAFVIDGTAEHQIDDHVYPVSVGDIYLISGKKSHCFQNTKKLVLANIMFDSNELELPFEVLCKISGYRVLFELEPRLQKTHQFHSHLKLLSTQMSILLSLRSQLENELRDQRPGYLLVAKTLFLCILFYLSRFYSDMPNAKSRALSRIELVLNFLEKNYNHQVSIDFLAHMAFMSESTLIRHFNEATELSPIEYLIHLRIKKACDLLLKSDMSITEISYQVGFPSNDYFSRQFRKIVGMTPSDYRKSDTLVSL